MKVIGQSLINRGTIVQLTLSVVLCLGIMVVGIRFLLVPESSAVGYGIAAPMEGTAPYLAAKGLRDLSFGVIGLTLIIVRQFKAAGWVMIAVSMVPFGDALIVVLNGGSPVLAYAVHGGTGIALVLVGGFLVRNQRVLVGTPVTRGAERERQAGERSHGVA